MVILLLLLIISPFLLGELVSYKDMSHIVKPMLVRYMMGLFLSLSLFWVLCTLMTLLKATFTMLTVIYSFLLLILCATAIWICQKKDKFIKWPKQWRDIIPKGWERVYLLLFVIALGIQLYYTIFYTVTIWSYDDSRYIVYSIDAISSDHMYLNSTVTGSEINYVVGKRILNSWPIYIAYLSKMSGIHVTAIAHTIVPAVFLLIAYGVYWYMAGRLFRKTEDKYVFLIFVSVLFIFGFYSQYSLSFRLLATLWQGKAILMSIVIPFLIVFMPKVYKQKLNLRTLFYVCLCSMMACSLSMMGAGMVIIVYLTMWSVLALYKRRLIGIWYCVWGCVIPAGQIILYFAFG